MSSTLAMADKLRARGVQQIAYFHTDHFEPWGHSGVTPGALRGVERFTELAARSKYGRRLNLFYHTHNPYRLDTAGTSTDRGRRVPGDAVVFAGYDDRSLSVNADIQEVMRPLVGSGSHEIHLHVHHEWWTCNSHGLASPVSRWVNERNDPEADAQRLELLIGLSVETVAAETGAPFDRWAFVHGNWALCASDDQICRVESELEILMRCGAWGDFTFPAGRSRCDPKLRWPFTCKPARGVRAFELDEAEPRPIGAIGAVPTADRFFIWNSPVTARWVSLDWYSEENLRTFSNVERVITEWIDRSVLVDGVLYLKTHAHSLKGEYRIGDSDNPIPHTHPDVVALFDELMRACDDARVEFVPSTVSEIARRLGWDLPEARPADSLASTAPPAVPAFVQSAEPLQDEMKQAQPVAAIATRTIWHTGAGDFEISTYGHVERIQCPVCSSTSIRNIWRLPLGTGGVSTLAPPFLIYSYDFCDGCESIFLNPDIGLEDRDATSADSESEHVAWEAHYFRMSSFWPEDARVLIAGARGAGRILDLAREDVAHRWDHLIAIDPREDEASEAHVLASQGGSLTPQQADFISLVGVFESARAPLSTIGRLLRQLRPGGRLYFTALRYGRRAPFPILPGEPVYIGRVLIDRLPDLLGCRLVDVREIGPQFAVVLERTTSAKSRETAPAGAAHGGFIAPPKGLTIPLTPPFRRELGHCFVVKLDGLDGADQLAATADSDDDIARSPWRLLEDGQPLGPGHSAHARIREEGGGHYSHWRSELYFSASDNSDPNTNGRRYALEVPS